MRGRRMLFSITFWVTLVLPSLFFGSLTVYLFMTRKTAYLLIEELSISRESIYVRSVLGKPRDCAPIQRQIKLLNYPPTFTFLNKIPVNVIKGVLTKKSWVFIDSKLKKSQLLTFLNRIDFIFTHPTAYISPKTASVLSQLRDEGTQYINAIDRMYNVTGNKLVQRRVMEEFAVLNGCSLDRLGFMPKTFLLGELEQCKGFFRYAKRANKSWILKPYSGEGGVGITIHPNVTSLRDKFNCKTPTKYLVQEYIRPLLLDGRKFDVRAYFLIARTSPYLVFYHHGYLRLSLKKFVMNSDPAIHLVNTHMQSQQEGYKHMAHTHMWTFDEFQQYLTQHKLVGHDWVESVLETFLKKVAIYIFHSGLKFYVPRRGSFQLVGLDCLVDSDFRPWFTESNNYPLWIEAIPEDVHNTSVNLGREMLELVFMLHQDPPPYLLPGYSYGGWKLIYNQQSEGCSPNHSEYQPCSSLYS